MILYVLGRNEDILGTLSNEDLANPNLLAAEEVKNLNGINTLNLTINNETDFVREENYIIYKNNKHEWEVFVIREVTEFHDETFSKEVVCEHSSQELLDYIPTYNAQGVDKTPRDILSGVLSGTRWSVGDVDTPETLIPLYDIDKGSSSLEIIHRVLKLYDYEINFRFNIQNNKILDRIIDIVENVGTDNGKRFEYTKDIESIERFVDSTEIKTAAIVIGGVMEEDAEKPAEEQRILDIVDLEWTSADGKAKTTKGQPFIEIADSTAIWGYKKSDGTLLPRMCRYENNSFTKDIEHLCEHAYEFLCKVKDPKITYKINAVDLYALTNDVDYAHEGVSLGDSVKVIDRVFNPPVVVETKVIEIKRNLLEQSEVTVTLGDKVKSLVNTSIMDSVNAQINDKINNLLQTELYNGLALLEQTAENLTKDKVDKESAVVNYNWIKNSDFTNNSKHWLLPLGGKIAGISGIPLFTKGATLAKGNNLVQIIQGGQALVGSTSSLSAFIKGNFDGVSGKLSFHLVYKNKSNVETTKVWESLDAKVTKDTWKRVYFAANLKAPDDFNDFIRLEAHYTCATSTSYATGLMVNNGSLSAKYIKNPTDKLGQGVWDEVSDIISDKFYNGTGYMYIEEGDGVWVYDKPTDQNPTKVTVMKGGQLGIGTWDANSQKWKVDTFIDGNSVNASCINTGTMTADRVRGGVLQSLDESLELDLGNTNKGVQFKKNGKKAIDISGPTVFFYDWEGTDKVGKIYSGRLDADASKSGIVVGNEANSYMSLVYASGDKNYAYIRFDKDNVDPNTPCPITMYQTTEFLGSALWFGHNRHGIHNSTAGNLVLRTSNNCTVADIDGKTRLTIAENYMAGYGRDTNKYFESGISASNGEGYFTFFDGDEAYFYRPSSAKKIWSLYDFNVDKNLHVNGNFTVSGTKNCVQSTKNHGDVLFYSVEDTESYLTETCSETLTVATTKQGTFERKIEIDPVVLECINTEIDYIVDIHKVGWGDYRIKEQARDYFIVESDREDFKFKYTIKGKRIGFEDMRLVKSVANVMAMAEHVEPKTRDIDMNELCDDVEHEVFIR